MDHVRQYRCIKATTSQQRVIRVESERAVYSTRWRIYGDSRVREREKLGGPDWRITAVAVYEGKTASTADCVEPTTVIAIAVT